MVTWFSIPMLGIALISLPALASKELAQKNACLACHGVDKKIVGPAYVDVANKYEATEANIEMLAGKIINGGSGSWGEIPMAPHTSLSTDDAKEMVKYILSLKTK